VALSAVDLLNAWEVGLDQPPPARALLLLAAAEPATPPDVWSSLSIGRRDMALLDLYAALFGPQIDAVADCPACDGRVEFDAPVDALWVDPGTGEAAELAAGGYRLHLRPPTSADLLALGDTTDPATAEALLLARCVSVADDGGNGADQLPAAVVEAAVSALADLDPAADLRFDLVCPTCGHGWEPLFDVAAFLWAAVERWALLTLRDVHQLALAYGWGEADVLALSPLRRQLYLEMAYG
jgi:hypothetical protein